MPARAALAAAVILPPLQQRRLELHRQQRLQRRDVLIDELLLEIDRVRGNHRLPPRAHGVQDRWNQVGERFPDARSRLHHEMPAALERPRHGARHFLLLLAPLEARPLRKQPVGEKISAISRSNAPLTGAPPPSTSEITGARFGVERGVEAAKMSRLGPCGSGRDCTIP